MKLALTCRQLHRDTDHRHRKMIASEGALTCRQLHRDTDHRHRKMVTSEGAI